MWVLPSHPDDSAMTFITVDKRGRATFPASVRRDLGLDSEDGSLVLLEKTDHGTYELVPAAMIRRISSGFTIRR
jgi:AbrB family looped-hinge helix DNA binding protein